MLSTEIQNIEKKYKKQNKANLLSCHLAITMVNILLYITMHMCTYKSIYVCIIYVYMCVYQSIYLFSK